MIHPGTYPKIKNMSPQLLVTSINRSIEFYKKLGFEVNFRYEDFYCGIIKDRYSIHLKLARPAIEERENRRRNEHLDITFSVEGIEDLYEDFLNKSVEIIQPLRHMHYGKEFYLIDPDGYIIAFLEEVSVSVSPDPDKL